MAASPRNSLRLFGTAFAAISAGILATTPSRAAPPQILALVATAEPTPLVCANGACGAEFTTFCLQSFRETPGWGTAYKPAEGSDLTLFLNEAAGTTRELDATPYIVVDSERAYASVRISVPEKLLGEWGATSVALRVGAVASLVPETIGDLEHAMTPDEVADYTGPIRERAEQIYYEDADAVAVAATAQKLENARQREPELDLSSLWDAFGGAPGPASPAVLRKLAEDLNACVGDGRTLAHCIQSAHETTIAASNRRVWQGLDAGM